MVFDKLKRLAGIGTLDVTVVGPDSVDLATGTAHVVVNVRAKGDCEVSSVELTFVNEWEETQDRNHDGVDTEQTRTKTLGRAKLPGFTIAAGEQRTVEFDLTFTPKNVGVLDDKLREKGGLLGQIGDLGLLSSARGSYDICAEFDVVGAANDPNDSRTVRVV